MHLARIIYYAALPVFILTGFQISAQNLVRNCNLEEMIVCPSSHGQLAFCNYWYSPGPGTSDYLNACNNGSVGVPVNQFGYQLAHSGQAYAHLILYYPRQGQYREYMQCELACTLQAGKEYKVSFYVSCADDSRYAIDAIGMYFSTDAIQQSGLEQIPITGPVHVENTQGAVIDSKTEWVMINGTYVANGGERFVTIGNFQFNDNTTVQEFASFDLEVGSYYIDDISVECTTPILDLGNDTTICPYDSILIDVSNICNNANLVWNDGTTELVRWLSSEGTYSIHGTLGCNNFYNSITITHYPDPVPFLSSDTIICPGGTLELSSQVTFDEYLWQDGSTDPAFTAQTAGTFWLEATEEHGCSFSDTVNVGNLTAPWFDLGTDTTLCIGRQLLLDPMVDSAFNNFLWSDNSHGLTLLVEDSGYYWLRITNPCGDHYDDILVDTRNCSPTLFAPNAFTPNGDGLNDQFQVEAANIFNFRMLIFDRWGQKVFESDDITMGWDGSVNNSPAPMGNYVWIAFYEVISDDWTYIGQEEKGSILLLR